MQLIDILIVFHYGLTLMFGIYVSATFLGINLNIKNNLYFLIFFVVAGLLLLATSIIFGFEFSLKIYPLIIHLPIVLFLVIVFHCRLCNSLVSVMTAYLCCQIGKWCGIVFNLFINGEEIYYLVRIIVTIITLFILIKYVSVAVRSIFVRPPKELLVFAIIPVTYYVFDYITCVYTELLYSGFPAAVEFMGFVLCVTYLVFILVYFRQYVEKLMSDQNNRLLEMSLQSKSKEIENTRNTEYEIAIMRHDMRHYLTNIASLINEGKYDKVIDYINDLNNTLSMTVIKKYCENDLVNAVLSIYESKCQENKIKLETNISIPNMLKCSETDFSTMLSNGLENAFNAVLSVNDEPRIIVDLKNTDSKLLLSIKNPYSKEPVIIDGMPVTSENGHGYGTRSISYIANKLGGDCWFKVSDGLFILQIII